MGLTLLTERYAAQIAGVLSCSPACWCSVRFRRSALLEACLRTCTSTKSGFSTIHALPSRSETDCGRTPGNWRPTTASRLSTFARRTSAKRTASNRSWRSEQPGLVCIFSAMEPCATYKPRHDPETRETYLKPTASACTTTSTFSTKNWGWATSECRPGCRAGSGLLQRPQLAGRATEKAPYRLSLGGQRVRQDRRLGTGAAHRGWMAGQADSLEVGRIGETLLPHLPRLRRSLPLEPGPVRVRHRHRLSPADRVAGHLRQPHPHRDPYCQTGQHRHVPGQEAGPTIPGRDGQPVQHFASRARGTNTRWDRYP